MDQSVQAEFTKLAGLVSSEATVVAAVQTLLNGLSAQIAALKQAATATAGTPAEVIAAISNLESAVQANSTALSQAVTANTPAA